MWLKTSNKLGPIEMILDEIFQLLNINNYQSVNSTINEYLSLTKKIYLVFNVS